jgi:two-component system sensor histidine kinase DegS
VTSTDRQPIAAQLLTIAAESAEIMREANQRIAVLAARADRIRQQTNEVSSELRQFLDQFALESGIGSGPVSNPQFAGGMIDVAAMRADIAQMAIDEDQAIVMAESMEMLIAILEQAAPHFSSPSALTRPFDPSDGHLQLVINQAREEERKRLAREIHDGPAQVLANAIYQVQNVEQVVKRSPELVPDEITQLREMLKEGVAEVRRFMFDLQPTTLQHYGLGPSIQRYVDMYGKLRGQHWTCSIKGTLPNLKPDHDLVVFRVIQESLHNAQKHAGVDATVDVTLQAIDNTLEVVIRDNGKGFDTAMVAPKMTSGAGLQGMRDRAAGANAQIIIESEPGKGTTVTLIMAIGDEPDAGVPALV